MYTNSRYSTPWLITNRLHNHKQVTTTSQPSLDSGATATLHLIFMEAVGIPGEKQMFDFSSWFCHGVHHVCSLLSWFSPSFFLMFAHFSSCVHHFSTCVVHFSSCVPHFGLVGGEKIGDLKVSWRWKIAIQYIYGPFFGRIYFLCKWLISVVQSGTIRK